MRKILSILLFCTINICFCFVQAQVSEITPENLKTNKTLLSFQKECQNNIQWEPSNRLLSDTTQNKLFQEFNPMDFEKSISSWQKSDSLRQMPVWVPEQRGSLLIKVPEDANNGFLLIIEPD